MRERERERERERMEEDNVSTRIRLEKVYRETVPVTLLLDQRQPFSLESVLPVVNNDSKLLKKETVEICQEDKHDQENQDNVLKELSGLLTRTEQRIDEMGSNRDITASNLLLGRNKRLREYATRLSDAEKNELAVTVREKYEKLKRKLLEAYISRREDMNRRGMFCDAANEKRARNILRVELRRIDPDCLEIEVLKERMQTVSSSDMDIAELREMFSSTRRSRLSNSISTPLSVSDKGKEEEGENKDEDEEEARKSNEEKKRMKMEKQQKERNVDLIPYQLRLRALGRAGASRNLRFRRLRKPRLLGQFVKKNQENKNAATSLKRSLQPPAAPHTTRKKNDTNRISSSNLNNDNDEIQKSLVDEAKRGYASLSRNHHIHRTRSELGEATKRRKEDIDRIERVWNDLEYPVQERMAFLCKYSEPENAMNLRPVIDMSVQLCELILMRETVLFKMRSLQDNPKKRLKWEHVFTAKEFEFLSQVKCSIDTVDYFGVSNFFRLAAIARKLTGKCVELLQYLRRDFGEILTYRGADYLQCLRSSESIESAWQGSDWRKAAMPPLVKYLTNPYLRRMGDSVL